MKKRGQYGQPSSSFGESVIPLVLILILAVFIAGKFGLVDLHSIPLLGGLFPAPYLKVMAVGQASPGLTALLTAEDYRVAGVSYAGSIAQEAIYPGVFNNIDIIVLQNERGTTCDRTARKTIADAVKAGKKLIVIGDACTRVSDDPNALGWDVGIGSLGDVMPVRYGGVIAHERTGQGYTWADGRFKIIAQDSPIFNGILNFGFTGKLVNVFPNANSNVLAYVDMYGGKPTSPATYAIVESTGFMSGKTVYFAFDPSTTSRNMFLNTLLYIKGAKG